jgi:hypothetical protein
MNSEPESRCNERRCPAWFRWPDTIKIPVVQERLPQLKGRKLSLCFYCGSYHLEDETALRVVTYAEFGCLGEGARAVLVRTAMRC